MNNQTLRFCYECSHFKQKNGIPNEFICEINTKLHLNHTSEANQCINNGMFEIIKA